MIPGLPYDTELPERVGVLVLGSGLAGCAALLAAAEAGQFAVMLEKTSEIGGSTVKSAGLSAFAGTDEQAAQGIADSVELLRKDLLEVGRHRNDERLVDLYCDHQLDTYEWLKRPRRSVRRGARRLRPVGAALPPDRHHGDARRTCSRRPAGSAPAWCWTARSQRLVREGGRVVGVDVRTPDGIRRVLADAVVRRHRRLLAEPRAARPVRPADGARAACRRRRLRGRRPADGLAAGRRGRGHALHQGDLRPLPRDAPRRGRHRHPGRLQGCDRRQPGGPPVRRRVAATTRRSATAPSPSPG